jgi:hypothetical protein
MIVTASLVPSPPIYVMLMMEAISSSETWVLTRATRRKIPEDTIVHSHRCELLRPSVRWLCDSEHNGMLVSILLASCSVTW